MSPAYPFVIPLRSINLSIKEVIMSVVDIRHKQIERLTAKLIPIMELEDIDICTEALGVISAMLATSVLEEFGEDCCENFKTGYIEASVKHMDRV